VAVVAALCFSGFLMKLRHNNIVWRTYYGLSHVSVVMCSRPT